jgi:hypothetical protein
MNNAPEGLEYGTDNYKYAKADALTEHLEKGKYMTAGEPGHAAHEEAEMKRMLGCCSSDPMYESSKKNK